METDFHVIIVGGGLAGCATALSLASWSPMVHFVLLDDAEPNCFKIGESLPPESTRLLYHLHASLPDNFLSSPHLFLPCAGNLSIWASDTPEDRHAILNPFGSGFHLDRAAFDELIRSTVSNDGDARSHGRKMRAKVVGVERRQDSHQPWTLRALKNTGETLELTARWIVDASGRKASVATKVRSVGIQDLELLIDPPTHQLGAKTIITSPLLAFYALFATVDDEHGDRDTRTLIEACATGWFYTSLVPHIQSSETNGSRRPETVRIVAYHTLPSHPSAKAARRRTGFLDLLHTSTKYVSAVLQATGYDMLPAYPKCTAAGSSHLDKALGTHKLGGNGLGGWLAVGDAACAFDPLSAQGMMSALESGMFVGRWLGDSLTKWAPSSTIDGLRSDTAEPGAEHQESNNTAVSIIEDTYATIREEYELSRKYYYSIVKRFGDEGVAFWDRVIE